jgi:hypothetical protein
LNPASIPKVAPTGVESTNPIKDMADHFELSRHSSRQTEFMYAAATASQNDHTDIYLNVENPGNEISRHPSYSF